MKLSRMLDHPGLMLNDPIGPTTRLATGEGVVCFGGGTKSAAVYKELLALWKDAGPDVPLLRQAKMEYAKLKSIL